MSGYEKNLGRICQKTKRTNPSEPVPNEGELRVKENTDRKRADSENELREYKDSEIQSRPSSRSSRSSISSRSSRKSTKIDMTQRLLNYIENERLARVQKEEEDTEQRERDRIAREKK